MISKVVVTHQMEDPALAAKELIAGIHKDFALKRNSVGLLFCYSDMELEGLSKLVSEGLGFGVVGCTGVASLDTNSGFQEMSVTLLVLTADDCDFSIAASGSITAQNVRQEVEGAYQKALAKLQGKPELLVAFPPYMLDVTLDEFTNIFNGLAQGISVVGGIPSHHGQGDINATFLNAEMYKNTLVLLLISGNIKPVSVVKTVSGSTVDRKREVTKARANIVYRVGNQTFTEYLEEVGLDPVKMMNSNHPTTFVSNPLLLENVEVQGEKHSFARTLHKVDAEEGSGTAVGYIPEGATLSVCTLQRNNIEDVTTQGMHELIQKIEENSTPDYRYSTILAISCIGRYLVMLPQSDTEAKQMMKMLPKGIELSGFYSYGEIGPVILKSGEAHIFAYNESLVLCAF